MTRTTPTIALILLPMLAACTTMTAPPTPRGPCVVSEAARIRYAGMKYRPAILPDLLALTQSAGSRALHADDVVTQDYWPDRLNILLDDGGLIDGLRCG